MLIVEILIQSGFDQDHQQHIHLKYKILVEELKKSDGSIMWAFLAIWKQSDVKTGNVSIEWGIIFRLTNEPVAKVTK